MENSDMGLFDGNTCKFSTLSQVLYLVCDSSIICLEQNRFLQAHRDEWAAAWTDNCRFELIEDLLIGLCQEIWREYVKMQQTGIRMEFPLLC